MDTASPLAKAKEQLREVLTSLARLNRKRIWLEQRASELESSHLGREPDQHSQIATHPRRKRWAESWTGDVTNVTCRPLVRGTATAGSVPLWVRNVSTTDTGRNC